MAVVSHEALGIFSTVLGIIGALSAAYGIYVFMRNRTWSLTATRARVSWGHDSEMTVVELASVARMEAYFDADPGGIGFVFERSDGGTVELRGLLSHDDYSELYAFLRQCFDGQMSYSGERPG